MQVLTKFYERTFKDEDYNWKLAYKKAINWYGKYVLSNKDFENTVVKYEFDKAKGQVTIQLFCLYDINDSKKRHCGVCKEMYTRVYGNNRYNCNMCNMISFYKRVKEKTIVQVGWFKELSRKKFNNKD